jgi:hypothetical protein
VVFVNKTKVKLMVHKFIFIILQLTLLRQKKINKGHKAGQVGSAIIAGNHEVFPVYHGMQFVNWENK